MRLLFAFVLIGALAVGSYATSVSVTAKAYAADTGLLTNVYFENANAITSTTPSVITALSLTSSTGSVSMPKGDTYYVYSTEFTSAKSLPAGNWVVDLWAATSTSSESITVTIAVVGSTGTVATTVGSGSTGTITTTEGQTSVTVAGSATSVAADSYVRVALAVPSGTGKPSVTLYWGKAQGTNVQVPMAITSS